MRLRNIKGSREFISTNSFVIQNPTECKGNWNKIFHNNNPIHIEIGMGKGQFIHQLATLNPHINYIGIEKFSSVLYRALEKREEHELNNLFFLRIDAEILNEIFTSGEVSCIYLNFSDPWPKERHAKRRLTSPSFLNRYDKILSPKGQLIFKTDSRPLFDFSIESIKETPPWKLLEVTYDLHNNSDDSHDNDMTKEIMTEYEVRFAKMGNPIKRLVAYR